MTSPMIPGTGSPNRKPRNAGERRAKAVETVTGTGAGAIGSVFGAAKLRDTYKTDKPGNDVKLKRAVTHAGMKAMGSDPSPRRVARVARVASAVEHDHPPFKALATAVTLGATATAAHRYQEIEHWAQQRKQELGKAASAEGYVGTRRAGPKVRVAVPKREPRHLRAAGAHRDLTQRGDRARAAYRAAALQHGTKMMAALRQSGELLKADACLAGDETLGTSAQQKEQLMAMSAFGVEMIAKGMSSDYHDVKPSRSMRSQGMAYTGSAAYRRGAADTRHNAAYASRNGTQRAKNWKTLGGAAGVGAGAGAAIGAKAAGKGGAKLGAALGGVLGGDVGTTRVNHRAIGQARQASIARGDITRGHDPKTVGLLTGQVKRKYQQGDQVQKSLDVDAFGVEIIGKAAPVDPDTGQRPTTGRYVAGYLAAPIHGAVAGKKGKKVAAAGSELGHSMGGAVGGALLGAATKKPALASALTTGGAIGGSVMGVNSNQRKGRYKPQSTS